MNTIQLYKMLKSNINTKKLLMGIYASNRLPQKIKKRPCLVIVNTDPDTEPSEHWVVMYFSRNGLAEYFDSFGMPPSNNNLALFLTNNCKKIIFNNKRIQSLFSNKCGQYCLVYSYFKGKNKSLRYFLSFFDKYFENNDLKVCRMLSYFFCTTAYKTNRNEKENVCFQTCNPVLSL